MNDRPTPARPPLDATDRAIINHLQGGFPLCEMPYAAVASTLGLDETTLLQRLRALLDQGYLSRFGPLFQIERLGGRFCLAAMAVAADRFDQVAAQVNAHPEVAHNYQRDHRLNLWFVLATETPEDIRRIAGCIEAETGLPVRLFPKEREYFVDLRLRA